MPTGGWGVGGWVGYGYGCVRVVTPSYAGSYAQESACPADTQSQLAVRLLQPLNPLCHPPSAGAGRTQAIWATLSLLSCWPLRWPVPSDRSSRAAAAAAARWASGRRVGATLGSASCHRP